MKALLVLLIGGLFSLNTFAQHWESMLLIDLDGDGRRDSLSYELVEEQDYYLSKLIVKSSNADTLWFHPFKTSKEDFEDLLFQEDVTVNDWGSDYFNEKMSFNAHVEFLSLNEEDLNMDWIEFYAKKHEITPDKLAEGILSKKNQAIIYYRAGWRENLVMLVYVSELSSFVGYSSGEY